MKSIILCLLLVAGFAQAQHHHHGGTGDRKTVHGMLAFGTTEKVYLSHLPLFGRNHDYQVLLEVTFDKNTHKKYTESLAVLGTEEDKENPNKYHTVEPEAFLLPEMMQDGNSFEVRLVRGHYERENWTDVAIGNVTIQRVLYFAKFEPEAKRDEKSRWILFGNKEEQFAAHLISQKPDFDQIFSGTVPAGVAKQLEEKRNMVGSSELSNSPASPEKVDEDNKPVKWSVLGLTIGDKDTSFSPNSQIYLDENELK